MKRKIFKVIFRILLYSYSIYAMMITPYLWYENHKLTQLCFQSIDILHEYENLTASLLKNISDLKTIKCTASAYTPTKEECDDTPHETAILKKSIPGRTVAVSRDLSHLLGKTVYVEDLGIRVVEDLMNPRYKNSIDVLFATREEATTFGKKQIKLVVIN
jgi:3D (Asp-Asp-Asp) domain-containing protein